MTAMPVTQNQPANDKPGYAPGQVDTRPWGQWEVLDVGFDGREDYCVKKITINPGGVLSLQSHNHRREYWVVLSGTVTVMIDRDMFEMGPGETTHVPVRAKHRMVNKTSTPVIVLEIQSGQCREDDITRYEDVYGRM